MMDKSITIQERLSALPAKTSKPLLDLLARGLISEKAVLDVIDAGELSGDFSKLLAFAIGYQYLANQGTPVSDTIKMAKELGLKVNLGWSQKRWKSEHDRYTRAITLKKLSEDNYTYNLDDYKKALPLPISRLFDSHQSKTGYGRLEATPLRRQL